MKTYLILTPAGEMITAEADTAGMARAVAALVTERDELPAGSVCIRIGGAA